MLSQQYGGGKWRTSIPKIPTAANIPRYEIVSDIAAVKQPAVTVTKQTKAVSPPPESTARRSEVTEPKIERETAPTPEPKVSMTDGEANRILIIINFRTLNMGSKVPLRQ